KGGAPARARPRGRGGGGCPPPRVGSEGPPYPCGSNFSRRGGRRNGCNVFGAGPRTRGRCRVPARHGSAVPGPVRVVDTGAPGRVDPCPWSWSGTPGLSGLWAVGAEVGVGAAARVRLVASELLALALLGARGSLTIGP